MVFIFLDFFYPPRRWGRGGRRFILHIYMYIVYTTTDCFRNFIKYHVIIYITCLLGSRCTRILYLYIMYYICVCVCVYVYTYMNCVYIMTYMAADDWSWDTRNDTSTAYNVKLLSYYRYIYYSMILLL